MNRLIFYFPQTYVFVKRTWIALHKARLFVVLVFQVFRTYLPCLRPVLRVLFSRKCTLKKLIKAFRRAINLKGLDEQQQKLEANPKGLVALRKQWQRDFHVHLTSEKEEELKNCIINQQTKSVALFCVHPHLVVSSVSFDHPLPSRLLSLAIEHNNKPCINMLYRNFWPSLQKNSLFRMRLAMGEPQQEKKFFKKAKKIYQHPRQTQGYMMLFALSGNIPLLRKFIQKAPWFEGLPLSIQQEVENLVLPNLNHKMQVPQNFSMLFRKDWCNLATQQEDAHEEPSLERITQAYQNTVPSSFLKIIPHLPFTDYDFFNTCIQKSVNGENYASLKNQLLNPPVGFSISDFTPTTTSKLVNVFLKGALSSASFNSILPLDASWKNIWGVGENYHSLSWDHLALSCLAHPNQNMLSVRKQKCLSNPLNPSSKFVCENITTRNLLQKKLLPNELGRGSTKQKPIIKRKM